MPEHQSPLKTITIRVPEELAHRLRIQLSDCWGVQQHFFTLMLYRMTEELEKDKAETIKKWSEEILDSPFFYLMNRERKRKDPEKYDKSIRPKENTTRDDSGGAIRRNTKDPHEPPDF